MTLHLVLFRKRFRRLREARAYAYALMSRAKLETEKALSRPLKPPLMLDGHTYEGVLGGLVALAGRLDERRALKPLSPGT